VILNPLSGQQPSPCAPRFGAVQGLCRQNLLPRGKIQHPGTVLGCGVIDERLAACFLVSELVCASVFSCGHIRGRENTKDLRGSQRCRQPEPLACQQQILTSLHHLVLLSFCQRRGAGKHFWEDGGPRSGTDRGFAPCREDECSVRGKRCGGTGWEGGKEPVGSTGWSDVVSHPLPLELLGFACNSSIDFCKSQIAVCQRQCQVFSISVSVPEFAAISQSQRCKKCDVVRQYPVPDVNAMKI